MLVVEQVTLERSGSGQEHSVNKIHDKSPHLMVVALRSEKGPSTAHGSSKPFYVLLLQRNLAFLEAMDLTIKDCWTQKCAMEHMRLSEN